MLRFRLRPWAILVAFLALVATPLLALRHFTPTASVQSADSVRQGPIQADMKPFNLAEMVRDADKIYRGTVISTESGTIEAGGGQLPIVTYRIKVDEAFRGTFDTVKGVQIAEIRMLGKMPPVASGELRRISVLPEMPKLAQGESYLVFTTRPVNGGLSATVGLGQGNFHILQGKEPMAVNEFNNRGLFKDMDQQSVRSRSAAPNRLTSNGPIPYDELARQIRAELGQ
jgi:hypothetical protein